MCANVTAGTTVYSPEAGNRNLFGESLSMAGDFAAVGSRGYDDNDFNNAGAVFLFAVNRTSQTLDFLVRLGSPEPKVGDNFGTCDLL